MRLSAVTLQYAYSLPHIDDCLDALAGSRYFGTLDLMSGYVLAGMPLGRDAQAKLPVATRSGL